jgi:hypothetical protein
VQLEPEGKTGYRTAWHTKVLAGNIRGRAILWPQPVFKKNTPEMFAQLLPVVKQRKLEPQDDRLVIPTLVVTLEHEGPIWDEERTMLLLAKQGSRPEPFHMQPAFPPGQTFTLAAPLLHPKVHAMIQGGQHTILLSTQSQTPNQSFTVPFPTEGLQEAYEKFLEELKEQAKTLLTEEEDRAQFQAKFKKGLEKLNETFGK